MSNSEGDAIRKLLDEGKSSREIINMGHKKGTVYGTQRKWRQERAQHSPDRDDNIHSTAEDHASRSADTSPDIESDPEIVRLKKEIRKAELEKQLDSLKVPLDMEIIVSAARDLGRERQEMCGWMKDDACRLWRWPSEEDIPRGIGEPVPDGTDWWRVKPSPIYCAMCLIDLQEQIDGLGTALRRIPLYEIACRFACQCGTKGMVAVAIKCTKCGKGVWWGHAQTEQHEEVDINQS